MQGRPFPGLELAGLVIMVALAVWMFVRAKRRSAPFLSALCGSFNLLTNLIITAFIVAHLVAVCRNALAGRGLGGAEAFVYDFHFYSLILVGAVILVPALVGLRHSWRLALGNRASWNAVVRSNVVLLAVNLPLAPLQGFAVGFSAFIAVNLVLLLAGRKVMTS